MLTKAEKTLLYFAGYEPCTCENDKHWRIKDGHLSVDQNPRLYEKDLKKILYGK